MVTWLYSCRLLGRKILAPAPSGPKKKICDEVCHLQLDKLQMGSELGRGGFSKVNSGRLVTEEGHTCEVAVKRPLEFNTATALELRREAQMTQRCWCEFVPKVFGIIETPLVSLLVMEHAGMSLSVLDSMPHQEFFKALASVAAALHAQKQVAHLDVKPSNVLRAAAPNATSAD